MIRGGKLINKKKTACRQANFKIWSDGYADGIVCPPRAGGCGLRLRISFVVPGFSWKRTPLLFFVRGCACFRTIPQKNLTLAQQTIAYDILRVD